MVASSAWMGFRLIYQTHHNYFPSQFSGLMAYRGAFPCPITNAIISASIASDLGPLSSLFFHLIRRFPSRSLSTARWYPAFTLIVLAAVVGCQPSALSTELLAEGSSPSPAVSPSPLLTSI